MLSHMIAATMCTYCEGELILCTYLFGLLCYDKFIFICVRAQDCLRLLLHVREEDKLLKVDNLLAVCRCSSGSEVSASRRGQCANWGISSTGENTCVFACSEIVRLLHFCSECVSVLHKLKLVRRWADVVTTMALGFLEMKLLLAQQLQLFFPKAQTVTVPLAALKAVALDIWYNC